jgi:triosephosphate isomerase
MSRTPLVFGNWKLHLTRAGARAWCASFRALAEVEPLPSGAVVGIAPTFTSLDAAREGCAGLPVLIGGQDLHWEPSGAFTGEVSAEMLREAGASHVIVGHSERRHIFGESDERIGRKVAAAREAGLVPILCVGETEDEREAGRTAEVIEAQLRRGLASATPASGAELVLAYEPVWAIGTGRVAQPPQVEEAHGFLRSILAAVTSRAVANEVRILYGGSVNAGNAPGLSRLTEVDGFLVGGASLDPAVFRKILEAAVPG